MNMLSTNTLLHSSYSIYQPEINSVNELKDFIITSLEDDKAEDIVVINLQGKSDMAEYMIIASGYVDRHVGAIANNLAKKLKTIGISDISIEGMSECSWVLVDTQDIIVHIFKPETREFYNLEKMWQIDIPATE